jgi:pyruvate dehydrogenase E2 component (dihydrolipoyllysine-residue acetyltransferase)
MAISVVMPALELTQETGKLVAWRKREGEPVAKGEILLEVETDKAVVEIEATADGVLANVKAVPGDVIPVGKTIAWIVSPGEVPPREDSPSVTPSPVAARQAQTPQSASAASQPGLRRIKISPKARRLAHERNVDVARIRGTGPGGEILASDILASAESAVKNAPAIGDLEPLSTVGRLMAERTTQSWTSVPHFFVVREIDASPLVAALERFGPAEDKIGVIRVTYTDLLVALVARVLAKHWRMNASWADGAIRSNKDVNIALAIAVDEGVVTGVIRNADRIDLREISAQRRGLAERARASQLRPPDIAGATFTISNLGMYRVDAFSAIINPPQAAILAVGSISDHVVPVDGRPGIRPMMILTLSCDHRVIDGARAAAFLNSVAESLSEPEKQASSLLYRQSESPRS